MSLRLRRGTDAEREAIVFDAGELVYTTDFKELWAGDGSTPGGILVSSAQIPDKLIQNLNLNSNNIAGTGNIIISGIVQADQFIGALVGDVVGSVFSDDSTIIVNGQTGVVTASLIGDVVGSVFSDDSTIIVNGNNGSITTNQIFGDAALTCSNGIGVTIVDTDDFSALRFIRNQLDDDIADPNVPTAYGVVRWERNDQGGLGTTVYMQGGSDGYKIFNLTGGVFDTTKQLHFDMGGSLGVGKSPTTKLDVNGAGAFSEGVAADSITSSSYVQFGSITTTARNALTAVNGMVVYNTTDDRFQGYQAGAWINLDDGTAA